MKKVTSLKKRSQNCKIVKRKGKLRIINKVNPKYKQKQR
ncbi:50S ribosomal protein L36 [Candidatus Karelsulcia muelleri]